MIRILVNYSNGKFESMEIKGHANSGDYGKDVVCAGVSSVFIGGLNNLEEPESFDIRIEEGDSSIQLRKGKTLKAHDEIVLETIIVSLKTIAESYPKNVIISEN